jgi:hypothetical protein
MPCALASQRQTARLTDRLRASFRGFLSIAFLWGIATLALAQVPEIPLPDQVVRGKWSLQDPVDKILINLGSVINKKQRTLLNSGFSTFSQLIISYDSDGGTPIELFRVACTVKMDAWDEIYELARLDERPQTAVLRDFKNYINLCLTAEIVSQSALSKLAVGDGSLHAKVQIEQISADQAKKIKEWLIQQQTGVMQGLFSHMLQEITTSESIEIDVPVGPKPRTAKNDANDKNSGKIRLVK